MYMPYYLLTFNIIIYLVAEFNSEIQSNIQNNYTEINNYYIIMYI